MRLPSREEAARRLAARLERHRSQSPLVLGIPNGGVPMARIVADTLDADLDVVLVRRLCAEHDPEATIGAVSEDGEVHLDAHRRLSATWVAQESRRKLDSLRNRRAQCPVGSRQPLEGRTVIVVDDAITSGSTMAAALRGLRRRDPERLIVAVGASPQSVQQRLARMCDEWVCELLTSYASSSGHWYDSWPRVHTRDLTGLLTRQLTVVG